MTAYLGGSLHLLVLCLKLLCWGVHWVQPVLQQLITIIGLWHLSGRIAVLHDLVSKTGESRFHIVQLFVCVLNVVHYHNRVIKNYSVLRNKNLWAECLWICTETCIRLLGIWRRELPCKNLMMTEFLKLVKTRGAQCMETEWWAPWDFSVMLLKGT